VVEVQSDLQLRATAKQMDTLPDGATLSAMVNQNRGGRCAITLDPQDRQPGQQPYQGIVPLWDDHGQPLESFQSVLEHYMLQSEQLDTTLVLAANGEVAAGLLIQRLPVQGEGNLSARATRADEDEIGRNEDYRRIAMLASSLQKKELLTLDVDTVLRRLFWQEPLQRFQPKVGLEGPRFACRCSRERVSHMIRGLGREEAESILTEREDIEVGCDFCGRQYRFDAVDAAELFTSVPPTPGTSSLH